MNHSTTARSILGRAAAWATATEPGPGVLALVFLLYLFGAKASVLLTVMPEGMAVVWLPNCVLLAALIRYEGARYVELSIVAIAAEIVADWQHFTLLQSALFGAINVGEVTLAFALLLAWRFDARFPTPLDLAKFVLAGPIVASLAAALLGAWVYTSFWVSATSYLEFARIWWFGDALGLLIVTPLLLGFRPFRIEGASPPTTVGAVDLVVGVGALVLLVAFWTAPRGEILGMHFSPVLLLPFTLYVAARHPTRWAAAAVALIAVMVISALALGNRPFGMVSGRDAVIRAQEFLFAITLATLGLAALLAQLRERNRALREANVALERLNEELETRVEARTDELRRANERLASLASIDPLTELYNRRGLLAIGEQEFAAARRHGRSLCLMIADLDHFKSVNDRYGHVVGDETLVHCARLLRQCARASDSCSRFGGEEFVMLAPDTTLEGGQALAERYRSVLRETPLETRNARFDVTASIGVTVVAAADGTIMDVLNRADAAMYHAKAAGRDRVVIIAPDAPADRVPAAAD